MFDCIHDRVFGSLHVARQMFGIRVEDGSFKKIEAPTPSTKTPSTERKFDEGRGSTGNARQTLIDEMNAIDMTAPDAKQKLAALRPRVEAAQKAYQQRQQRRNN